MSGDKRNGAGGEDLYSRVVEGDRDALAGLIELYGASLSLFINGFVNDIRDVEEITIDTFVELIKNRSRFQGESSFKTYLFSIGRNLALRYRKNNGKRLPADGIGEAADDKTPEAEYLLEEGKQRLYRIIRGMKTDHREVLHLIYFEGMSYAESARILKKSERQIEGLLYRAKKTLKSRLESEGLTHEDF